MVPISVTKEQFLFLIKLFLFSLNGNYGSVSKSQYVPLSVEQELEFHFVPAALSKGKNGFHSAFYLAIRNSRSDVNLSL